MISLKYVLFVLIAVIFTWVLHEFSHWCVGELLGNDMVMTLNSSYPKSRTYIEPWNAMIVSAAGPLITLVQAVVFYMFLKRHTSACLFPFLLTCLYMRVLAGAMNVINLNDEGRISKALGLGTFTLPILMTVVLFYLTYDIAKARGYRTKFIVVSVLLITLFTSIVILGDQALRIVVLS